jgi:23S rRNA pseudouridine1911/1915/1917 synthase
VIDKPAGIPVHAGTRHAHPTVADALVARYPNLASIGEDPLRPGIVHRLDRDTSGVLLVARTPEMFATLKRKFQQRRVRKQYLALVHGVVTEDEGTVKLALKRSTRNPLRRSIARDGVGKSAETGFRVRERFAHYTLLDVFPVTGRMHQIRVHLAHLGFPIVGDQLYGKRGSDPALPAIRRQWLHAASVTLTLPSGKTGVFESPLPGELQEVLDVLREREKERTPKAPRLHFRMRSPRQTKRGR